MAAKEGLGCFVQLFEIGEQDLHILGHLPDGTGFEVAAGVEAIEDRFDFPGFMRELFDQFAFPFGNLLESFAGFRQGLFIVEVPLGQIHYRNAEQGRKFQEITDLRFRGAVFIGSDVTPVQAYPAGEFFLAHAEALAEKADVLMQVNRVIIVCQIHIRYDVLLQWQ